VAGLSVGRGETDHIESVYSYALHITTGHPSGTLGAYRSSEKNFLYKSNMNSHTFQVTNSTHSLSFQEYDGQRYHCQVKETKYAFVLRVNVFLRITSLVLPN